MDVTNVTTKIIDFDDEEADILFEALKERDETGENGFVEFHTFDKNGEIKNCVEINIQGKKDKIDVELNDMIDEDENYLNDCAYDEIDNYAEMDDDIEKTLNDIDMDKK